MKRIEEYTTLDEYPAFTISRGLLNELMESCSWLADDVSLRFNKEGLFARFTDPAHVAMTELRIPKENFTEYEFNGEAVITLELDSVKDLLRHLEKSEKLLRCTVTDPHKMKEGLPIRCLSIVVNAPFDYPGSVNYAIALESDEMPLPKWPNVSLDAKAILHMPTLYKAVRVVENFTDHLDLEYRDGCLNINAMSTTGHEVGGRCIKMPVEVEGSPAVRSLFPMDYFMGMVRAHRSTNEAVLHLSNDHPCLMEAATPSGLLVRVLIAPRIEED